MSPEQAELERPGRRHPERHLLAGRAALRAADRHDAAGARPAARGGASPRSCGGSARRSRRGRSTRLSDSGERWRRSRPSRQTEPARLTQAGAGRPRLDRDEGAGEGPDAAVRDGQRAAPGTSSATWTASRWRRARRRRRTGCGSSPASTARRWRRRRRSRVAAGGGDGRQPPAGGRVSGPSRARDATAAALRESEQSRKEAEAVSDFLVGAFKSPDPGRGVEAAGRRVARPGGSGWRPTPSSPPQSRGSCSTSWARPIAAWASGSRRRRRRSGRRRASGALGPDHRDTLESRAELVLLNRHGRASWTRRRYWPGRRWRSARRPWSEGRGHLRARNYPGQRSYWWIDRIAGVRSRLAEGSVRLGEGHHPEDSRITIVSRGSWSRPTPAPVDKEEALAQHPAMAGGPRAGEGPRPSRLERLSVPGRNQRSKPGYGQEQVRDARGDARSILQSRPGEVRAGRFPGDHLRAGCALRHSHNERGDRRAGST